MFKNGRVVKDIPIMSVFISLMIYFICIKARIDIAFVVLPTFICVSKIVEGLARDEKNQDFYIKAFVNYIFINLMLLTLYGKYGSTVQMWISSLTSIVMLIYLVILDKRPNYSKLNYRMNLMVTIVMASLVAITSLSYCYKASNLPSNITNNIDRYVKDSSVYRIVRASDANERLAKYEYAESANKLSIMQAIKDDPTYIKYLAENNDISDTDLAVKFLQDVYDNEYIDSRDLLDTKFVKESIAKYASK